MPRWADCRMMHPWEEAEVLMRQLDRGAALCRVLCRMVIWLLHTLIHPQPWEQSCSYTMHILLFISCTYGYKPKPCSETISIYHYTQRAVLSTYFFQTVYTNISKIREKTHVKWHYLHINYTLRNLKYQKRLSNICL